MARFADCVNRQCCPGSGKGEWLQPGLETHVKPNSNQMRLACFQWPLSIPVLARGRLVQIPSLGSRACLFPGVLGSRLRSSPLHSRGSIQEPSHESRSPGKQLPSGEPPAHPIVNRPVLSLTQVGAGQRRRLGEAV